MNNKESIPYPTPGETIREDVMEPMGFTAYQLAKRLAITQTALSELLHGKRSITAEMALRLEALTGASAQFWMNLQTGYDLERARKNPKAQTLRERIIPLEKMVVE